MFERFTDRARKVVGISNRIAQRLGNKRILTKHILLAILEERTGVAAAVLQEMYGDLDSIERILDPGQSQGESSDPWEKQLLSQSAKDAINFAVKEARAMHHNYIGTEHLLLGFCRVADPDVMAAIAPGGQTLEDFRKGVLTLLGVV